MERAHLSVAPLAGLFGFTLSDDYDRAADSSSPPPPSPYSPPAACLANGADDIDFLDCKDWCKLMTDALQCNWCHCRGCAACRPLIAHMPAQRHHPGVHTGDGTGTGASTESVTNGAHGRSLAPSLAPTAVGAGQYQVGVSELNHASGAFAGLAAKSAIAGVGKYK